jgi:hypothetical protein
MERLLAWGRRPESEGRLAAAGDRRVAPEAVFLARRWPTSGEKRGEFIGVRYLLGPPCGARKRRSAASPSPQ